MQGSSCCWEPNHLKLLFEVLITTTSQYISVWTICKNNGDRFRSWGWAAFKRNGVFLTLHLFWTLLSFNRLSNFNKLGIESCTWESICHIAISGILHLIPLNICNCDSDYLIANKLHARNKLKTNNYVIILVMDSFNHLDYLSKKSFVDSIVLLSF